LWAETKYKTHRGAAKMRLVGSFNQNKRKEGERERGKEEGKSEKKKKEER
jgi:hypothetical protein